MRDTFIILAFYFECSLLAFKKIIAVSMIRRVEHCISSDQELINCYIRYLFDKAPMTLIFE